MFTGGRDAIHVVNGNFTWETAEEPFLTKLAIPSVLLDLSSSSPLLLPPQCEHEGEGQGGGGSGGTCGGRQVLTHPGLAGRNAEGVRKRDTQSMSFPSCVYCVSVVETCPCVPSPPRAR